jgi:hypothetical protein
MPRKQHFVTLTTDERTALQDRLRRGAEPALTQTRTRVLLLADTGAAGPRRTDAQIAEAVGCAARSVARTRADFTERGVGCVARRPRAHPPTAKLDSADEARVVALACSPPPDGHARWTLRLLAGRAVELEIADTLSYETVRRTLKKTSSSRG